MVTTTEAPLVSQESCPEQKLEGRKLPAAFSEDNQK